MSGSGRVKNLSSQAFRKTIEAHEASGMLGPSAAKRIGYLAVEYDKYAELYAKSHNLVNSKNQAITHNNQADAVRHCAWSMSIAREFGPEAAKNITSMHERVNPNSQQEHHMDFHNNGVGINLAFDRRFSNYEPAVAAEMALKSGMLISSPNQTVPDGVLQRMLEQEREEQEQHQEEQAQASADDDNDNVAGMDDSDGVGLDHDIDQDFGGGGF